MRGRIVHRGKFSLHYYYKHKTFDEKMLLIFSSCLTVSSVTFIQYNNPNLNNCFQLINNSPTEKELLKLIWLNWVTSHSSASKIKKFQSKQVDIIVTDYHTWPAKLFWVCNNIGRQAPFFLTPHQVWLLKHRITKQFFK